MADLTSTKRDKLKASAFGLPGERKYPIPDRAHAANAKARATQQFNAGHISAAQRAQINRKANAKLGGKSAAESATTPGKK
jgi:hypothetical protein